MSDRLYAWLNTENGRTLWCVFSVYGKRAKQGIDAHDKFNVVMATLQLR